MNVPFEVTNCVFATDFIQPNSQLHIALREHCLLPCNATCYCKFVKFFDAFDFAREI